MKEQTKFKGIDRNHPVFTTYVREQGTCYIIEHETSPDAKETVYAKIKKLILRDLEKKYHSKRGELVIPLNILIDFLLAICNYIRNAWGLSGRRQQ